MKDNILSVELRSADIEIWTLILTRLGDLSQMEKITYLAKLSADCEFLAIDISGNSAECEIELEI